MSASSQVKKELTIVCRSDIVFCDAGHDVVLPCHLQPPISAASMKIKWLKRADLICHFKDGDVTESTDDMYKGRVHLSLPDLHNGNVSLTLRDVRAAHRGIYTCEVIHKQQTVKEYIFLHVRCGKLTLVASPTITAELGKDTILPVFLSPVTSAVSMEIKWYRENELIYLYKYGQETVFENQVDLSAQQLERGNLSITLRNVQLSDLRKYKCMICYDGSKKAANIKLRMRDSLHRRRNSMEKTPPLMREKSLPELYGQNRYGSTSHIPFYERKESLPELYGQNRYCYSNPREFYDSTERLKGSMDEMFIHSGDESSSENDETEQAGSKYYDPRNLDLLKKRQNNEESFKRQMLSMESSISAAKMTQPQNPGSTTQNFQERRQESIAPEQKISSVEVQSQVSPRKIIRSTEAAAAAAAAEIQTQKAETRLSRSEKNCQVM